MNRPIISLDFSRKLSASLDVSAFFPLSDTRPSASLQHSQAIETMFSEYRDIDLSIDKRVFLEEAKTDEWQDITPKIHTINKNRDNSIDLVPPISLPYGTIDVRKKPVKSKKKRYSDLFVRKLPRWLAWKRTSLKMRGFAYKKRYTFLSVALSILFLSVPTLFYIKYNIEDGYNRIISLKDASNISQVGEELTSARRSFERANFLFAPFSWIPFDMVDLAGRAGKGGLKITRSLESVVMAIPSSSGSLAPRITLAKTSPGYFRSAPKDIFLLDSLGIDAPTNWIEKHPKIVDSLVNSWSEVAMLYSEAKGNSRSAEQMRMAGKLLSQVSGILTEYQNGQEYWLQFLGSKTPQRYVVFNQNRDEIRANGGFPGSIISFTLYKGNILDYRSDDVYYYDWNLYPHKELPPPGIALLTENYGLRDVNYYPDFLQTLEKANSFVERSGEPTLTNAIAIHQGMIEDILSIIGPVHVDGISENFTADNFSTLMSVLVEGEVDREKTPKDVLFRFIEAFGKKIVQSRKFPEVFALLQKYWQNGEILVASRDENLQEFISKYTKPLPWKSEPKNWIYPVFTSLSGNKSDRYIDRNIQVDTEMIGECRFKNTVRMVLSHTYSQSDENAIKEYMDRFGMTDREARAKMQFIQGKGANKVYLRFFVPQGATHIEGSDFETVQKPETTVFTTTMTTPVGKKSTKTFSYQVQIPNCDTSQTTLDVIRQPGLRNFVVQ